jgi:cell division protease FtsH
MKELIRCADTPAFIFQGGEKNIAQGIIDVFEAAKKNGHSIVVFDELDLLLDEDKRAARALQEALDGVESDDDILVLAATNNIREISGPLTRNGRLEKLIAIPNPTGEEAIALLKKHFEGFGVPLPEDFDEDETSLLLNGISCAGVKAIVNDVVLRNGFENITEEMIVESVFTITRRYKEGAEEDNLQVAIHEAGHAVMAAGFPQYFVLNRLHISGASGEFHAKEVTRDFWPFKKVLADIQISLAGSLAEKIVCGTGSMGAVADMQKAREMAWAMLTENGYSSAADTLPQVAPGERTESQFQRHHEEQKLTRILKQCEKRAAKYIKAHRKEVRKLGQLLYERKRLKSKEIKAVIGGGR